MDELDPVPHLKYVPICDKHCVKSIRVRSYSGPYFPAFGLNTELSVFSPNAGE